VANFEGEIAQRVDGKPSDASEKINSSPELDEEPEDSEGKSLLLCSVLKHTVIC